MKRSEWQGYVNFDFLSGCSVDPSSDLFCDAILQLLVHQRAVKDCFCQCHLDTASRREKKCVDEFSVSCTSRSRVVGFLHRHTW